MNKAASYISGFLLSIVLVLALSAPTLAQSIDRYWTVKISKPAPVTTSSTVNLDYIVFSTVSGDTFDVVLLNNGSSTGRVDTVVSTGKGGDSGRFTINNVPNGSYTYSILKKNTADGSSQVSDSATFTVNTPDARAVAVSSGSNGTNVTAASQNTTANGTQVTTAATTAQPEAIAAITETSSAQAGTDVQGASSNNTRNFTIATLLLFALVGGSLWYGITRYIDRNET